jgi:hypothetical protein
MIGSGPAWAMNLTATIQAGAALAASPNPSLTNTELDIANFSAAVGSTPGPAGLVPPCAWGLMVGSSGTFATTAAIIVAANSTTTNFYRGVCVNTAMSAAFSDYSLASWGLEMSGTHTIGLNLEGMGGSTAMSIANGAAIVARNSAGTGGIGLIASTGNAVTIGNSATFVYMGDDTCPLVANAYNLGDAAARWAAVWAVNGTIQTSDPALKTDIAPLPSVLPLLAAINPVTFKWKDGGSETVEATEVQTVQERELLEWDEDRVEVVDGRAVLSTVHRSYLSEAFDEVPVFDAAGQPVHLKPPTREDKAARWREQTGGRPVVRTHRVPRMVTKEVAVKRQVSHAGRRTHWGFMAPEIKAAFDAMGMDFGGYVRGDDGTHNLRPDQLIAVLWKVCQELKAEIDAMKGATPA